MTPEVARTQGLPRNHGALVAEVVPGGPAAEAGVSRGDLIVSLDGRQVNESTPFHHMVAEMPVGRIVPVVVVRDGQERRVMVRIARQPE